MGTGYLLRAVQIVGTSSWGRSYGDRLPISSWGQVTYQLMGTGYLLKSVGQSGFPHCPVRSSGSVASSWGQVTYYQLMGTGYLLKSVGQSGFPHCPVRSSGSVARRLPLSSGQSATGTNRSARIPRPRRTFAVRLHALSRSRRHGRDFSKGSTHSYPPRFTRGVRSAPAALPSHHSSDRVRRRALPIRLHA